MSWIEGLAAALIGFGAMLVLAGLGKLSPPLAIGAGMVAVGVGLFKIVKGGG